MGELPPRRRRALLESAAREFAGAGYQRASLNRVIRANGMSKSSFYHYFDSKEALFDAVVTEAGRALVEAVDLPDATELAGPDFWDRIARLLDQLLALAERGELFTSLGRMFYLPDAPAGEDGALSRARAGVDDWLTRALEAGRSAGAVRDDLPPSLQARLALAVLWAMDEWSVTHLPELDADELGRLAAAQLDAIRRLLSP